jgi:hypothetical protein
MPLRPPPACCRGTPGRTGLLHEEPRARGILPPPASSPAPFVCCGGNRPRLPNPVGKASSAFVPAACRLAACGLRRVPCGGRSLGRNSLASLLSAGCLEALKQNQPISAAFAARRERSPWTVLSQAPAGAENPPILLRLCAWRRLTSPPKRSTESLVGLEGGRLIPAQPRFVQSRKGKNENGRMGIVREPGA